MRWIGLLGVVGTAAVFHWGCSGEEFQTSSVNAGGGGGMGGSGGVAVGPGGSGGSAETCVDADGDGVTAPEDGGVGCEGDCDDGNATVFPGAPELCGDGLDNACGNDPDPAGQCNGIGTYVSKAIGLDTNPGTQQEPVKTIAEGMNKAVALNMTQPVFVAEGVYPEDVTLQEGVDLWGGHSCVSSSDCTWVRNSQKYVSIIENQDDDGIYAGHAVTAATEIDGFTVLGLGGNPGNNNTYSAMFIQGSPVITGNIINSGVIAGCSQCRTVGINLSGAPVANESTLIERNRITGGDSSAATIGIAFADGATADVNKNEITGGQGDWTRCITMGGALGTVNIINNDMHAGSCNGNNTTFAMFLGQGVTPVIDSNRINADASKLGTCPQFSSSWWTGGIESEGGMATITNNIIKGVPSPRSTAIMLADCEGPCQLGQSIVINNTLDGLGMAVSAGNTSISAAIVFKTWKPGQNVVVGRVRNNILIGGVGQFAHGAFEDVNDQNGPIQGSTVWPQNFENNSIYGATLLYEQWDGTQSVALSTVAMVNSGVNNASSNVDTDCQLDAQNHLSAGSPCIDQGTTSGGETPTWDIDGETRPQGAAPDIGADEAG